MVELGLLWRLRGRAVYEARALQRDQAAAEAASRAAAELREQEAVQQAQLRELEKERDHRLQQPDQHAEQARQNALDRQLAEEAASARSAAERASQELDADDDMEIHGQDEWNQHLADQELGYDTPDLFGGLESGGDVEP